MKVALAAYASTWKEFLAAETFAEKKDIAFELEFLQGLANLVDFREWANETIPGHAEWFANHDRKMAHLAAFKKVIDGD